MGRIVRTGATAVLLFALLTACAAQDPARRAGAGDDDAPNPTPTSSAPTQPDDVTSGAEQSDGADDVPRDDLTNEHRVDWLEVEDVDGQTLRVYFTAGTTRCYGTRVDVREEADQVLIAVYEGLLPDAPNACTLEARRASLLVTLDAPLGGHEVVEMPR